MKDQQTLKQLVLQLAETLIAKQLKVVTVESCTGGLIGKVLTDRAGSSQWFAGGLITYTNESKHRLAKVPMEYFQDYGAVSTQVVEAMAIGALSSFDNCISVAVSGVAGPDGGSEDKPVGTVCIATGLKEKGGEYKVNAERYYFEGTRKSIRKQAVKQALRMIFEFIMSENKN